MSAGLPDAETCGGAETLRLDCQGVALRVLRSGRGRPVVVLHGFTGSARSMQGVADALADGFAVHRVDLVGHGQSDAPRDLRHYSMSACVAQLQALLAKLALERPHLIGYSMGGRVALSLAAAWPGRIASLLLVGASAGIAEPAARVARVRADEALARRIEDEGLEAFVEYWMALPLFASQASLGAAALARARSERLRNRPHALAASLRGMGSGAMPPLEHELPRLALPVCLVVGELDAKFREIAAGLARALPRARVECVAGAGHAAHLERPQAFARLAQRFLADAERAGEAPAPPAARYEVMEEPSQPPARSRPGRKGREMSSVDWKTIREYEDIRFERSEDGIAKVTICRPEKHNAFRPETTQELIDAFLRVREMQDIGVVLLTGEGEKAFCSGGDQSVRGDAGYVGRDGVPRLNVLDLQKLIRSLPKPVIALVAGYAIGGGHVLHLVCDLTIAADNARFGQTGPKVGSFDAGFGSSYMARVVGQKKAREIWFLCRQYDARQAEAMGLVNAVVPLADLETTGVAWAREILQHSPIAIRFLKAAMNADCDGQVGLQQLAGDATMLYYMSEEAQEGRDAYNQKRRPDFSRFPWRP